VEVGKDAATAATCEELAAKRGAEDPEGAFTSARPNAANSPPPVRRGGLLSGWVTGAATELPPAGLERASATTLDCPAMWRMTGANSAINDRWRCWRLEQGSYRRERAPTSGL
jgi:hypothetical protein